MGLVGPYYDFVLTSLVNSSRRSDLKSLVPQCHLGCVGGEMEQDSLHTGEHHWSAVFRSRRSSGRRILRYSKSDHQFATRDEWAFPASKKISSALPLIISLRDRFPGVRGVDLRFGLFLCSRAEPVCWTVSFQHHAVNMWSSEILDTWLGIFSFPQKGNEDTRHCLFTARWFPYG